VRIGGDSRAGAEVLVDIAKPLDFSHGMPPSLLVSNTDSLGEQWREHCLRSPALA
jgi:hypothetical protein